MTYELDTALRNITERLRRLELKDARNKPAGGVDFNDDGGYFGGGTLTIQDVLDLIGAGASPAAFYLRRYGGGSDTETLTVAPSVTADLANASVFLATLDQDVTFSVVGFLPTGRRSEFAFAITQDGTGGHTPTFSGFTWIGGTPTWDTTAGTVTDVVGFSDDGGTNIRAAVLGGGGGVPAGTYVLTIEGGQETINARGTLGATETVDPTDGNIITGTLDQDCTITLSAPTGSGGSTLEWWLTQSGGSWTPTFTPTGGTFQWDGGVTPTFPATGGTFRVVMERIPGTTNDWVGNMLGAGGGGTAATTVTDETTFGITPAVGTDTEYARQDHTHGTPASSAVSALGFVGAILIADTHSTPIVFADLMTTEDGSDLLYADI